VIVLCCGCNFGCVGCSGAAEGSLGKSDGFNDSTGCDSADV